MFPNCNAWPGPPAAPSRAGGKNIQGFLCPLGSNSPSISNLNGIAASKSKVAEADEMRKREVKVNKIHKF